MGIFNSVASGAGHGRSRYTKSMTKSIKYNARFYERIPIFRHFVMPGDVWRIGGDALIRFMPMASPTLTGNKFKVRYFFVPLRLLEEDTEIIITGSKNGKLYTGDEKSFKNFVADANKTTDANAFKVQKYGFWDYIGVQLGDYENIKNAECLPAQYWDKAYGRIDFDYYRDENYDTQDDFDDWYAERAKSGANVPILFSKLPKDYFTSTLPAQIKGVVPILNVTGDATMSGWDFGEVTGSPYANKLLIGNGSLEAATLGGTVEENPPLRASGNGLTQAKLQQFTDNFEDALNDAGTKLSINGLGFDVSELRDVVQATRIMERLSRCGSRYNEYLRSNFGIAPADETLQRAQYLGGWSLPIVTTEVLQTAEDGDTPVGTMRGHGISRGGNRIPTFVAKEFGVIMGLAELRPDTEYTTGIDRELTIKRRFDFPNPSFEHLSEDEVRKGELFINFTPDADTGEYDNDQTFGFQGMYNFLRTARNLTVADMRDGLSFWTQSLHFSTRPEVSGLLTAENHLSSFNAPFNFVDAENSRPYVAEVLNVIDLYRPLDKYAVPGYNDHF